MNDEKLDRANELRAGIQMLELFLKEPGKFFELCFRGIPKNSTFRPAPEVYAFDKQVKDLLEEKRTTLLTFADSVAKEQLEALKKEYAEL